MGRPVFSPIANRTTTVTLPPGMTLKHALAGLTTMTSTYHQDDYVFEETWVNRLGSTEANDGDLTPGEEAAVVSGDAASRHLRPIRIDRFLWRVSKVSQGRAIRVSSGASSTQWTPPALITLTRCDRAGVPKRGSEAM
eukprot:m.369946 g.369946  ORF g.369946 m.369946 type:complete len:138 (-) comp16680_c1_seq28:798-1211(-)